MSDMICHVYLLVLMLSVAVVNSLSQNLPLTGVKNIFTDTTLSSYEMASLSDLYVVMNGGDWIWQNSSLFGAQWNFTGDHNPCIERWQGIGCVSIKDQLFVNQLRLESYNLSGYIPTSISNFTELVNLDLSFNSITSTIPDIMGDLLQLTTLYLHNNQLRGSIPSSLGGLSQLTDLGLANNLLTGTLPVELSGLTRLIDLSVEYNNLVGTIPSEYSRLANLTSLFVEYNHLTGDLDQFDFTGLSHLWRLYINNNRFTGTVPSSLSSLIEMESLFIDHNSFSGSLPAMCGSTRLQVVGFNSNAFTGSIPECYGYLTQLVSVTLVGNHLTGRIPNSFSLMSGLEYFTVNNNLLSGSLPPDMRNLTSIAFLFLQSNLLSGSLDSLVDASTQTALIYLDLSMNQFTGSLPSQLHGLPALQSFAAATNCISGSISEDWCTMSALTFLNLDGMHTAASCQYQFFPSLGAILDSYMMTLSTPGDVPSCLFGMQNLTTLHLSGNAIEWSFPSDLVVSDSLQDLSLSHNGLIGTVPSYIQSRVWTALDLSYNKLTGELNPDNIFASSNQTSLSLQVNRLSGAVPSAMLSMSHIDLLEGNLFACSLSRDDLPTHDSQRGTYQCGSNSLNASLTVWSLFVLILLVVAALSLVVTSRYSVSHQSGAWISYCIRCSKKFSRAMSVFDAEDSIQQESKVQQFGDAVVQLRRVFLFLTLAILFLGVPIYISLTHFYHTLTHEYAWVLSAAFLSGVAPGVVLLLMFMVLLGLVVYLLVVANIISEKASHNNSEVRTGSADVFNYRRLFALLALTLFNCTVVVVVNGIYVYIVLTCDTSVITITQLLVAVFKLVWNEFAVLTLMSIARRYFTRKASQNTIKNNRNDVNSMRESLLNSPIANRDQNLSCDDQESEWAHRDTFTSLSDANLLHSMSSGDQREASDPVLETLQRDAKSGDVAFLVFIVLFNNILAPCLATAAGSPSCFRNVFLAAPAVHSSFPFQECPGDGFQFSNSCSAYGSDFLQTQYNPPFIYSYQCSSTFVTNYAEIYVYMFLFVAFLKPFVMYVLRRVFDRSSFTPSSVTFRFVSAVLPSIMKPLTSATRSGGTLFDDEKFCMQIASIVGVLLTFGVVLPPLAVVALVALYSHTYFTQFVIGSFLVTISNDATRIACSERIGRDCDGTWTALSHVFRVILPFALLFYAVFVFDTLGDAVGWTRAIWGPFAMVVFSGSVYFGYQLCYGGRLVEGVHHLSRDANTSSSMGSEDYRVLLIDKKTETGKTPSV